MTKNRVIKVVLTIVALVGGVVVVHAAGHSYTGPDQGDWETASNWSGSTSPNLQSSDTYTIGNGRAVVYTPLGLPPAVRPKALDWANNTTVTVTGSGSSWTQGSGDRSWIKIGDGAGKSGTLNVINGGRWSSGTSNTLVVFLGAAGANGFATVSAGSRFTTAGTLRLMNGSIFENSGAVSAHLFDLQNSAAFNNNAGGHFTSNGVLLVPTTTRFTNAGIAIVSSGITLTGTGTLVVSGGVMVATSEVKLHDAGSITVSGGALSGHILSFDGPATSTGVVTLSGGDLTLSTTQHSGILQGGSAQYINFTTGSASELRFTNIANAETNITTGKVRFNGSTVPNDGSVFTVSHPTKTATTIALRQR